MAIGYPPLSIPQSSGESIATLNASVTAQTFAANANRISGFILNFGNRVASVTFGTAAVTAGSANSTPIPAASSGLPGSIDLPEDFDGPIQIIWAAGVNTTGTAVLHEMI
jgi:hypothetical protein